MIFVPEEKAYSKMNTEEASSGSHLNNLRYRLFSRRQLAQEDEDEDEAEDKVLLLTLKGIRV
jgi:hypothetical protein